jgi:hypothetical protein
VNLKIWKKYVFLGKCISYHLSLGDFFEKCRFPNVLGAFLGLIQKIWASTTDEQSKPCFCPLFGLDLIFT